MLKGNFSNEDKAIIRIPDTMVIEADPLTLDLEDDVLVRRIARLIDDAKKFYNNDKIDLINRQEKNKNYLMGKQLNVKNLKRYQQPFIDNLIYEAEGTIKPIALSRLPDLFCKPAQESDSSKDLATSITKLINSDIRKRENRRVLSLAWRHHPVFFHGIIKPYWDPNEGPLGDYKFKVVHPQNIVLDQTCATNDPADMKFIAEAVELTVQEICMRWPKAEGALYKKLGIVPGNEDEKMLSTIKIWEVWFKWWEKKDKMKKDLAKDGIKSEDTGSGGMGDWQEVEAVCWKYDDLLLGKMRNPYWDWKGESKLVKADGTPAAPSEAYDALVGNIDASVQKVYANFFTKPQKPYILLNYDLMGEYPIDYTSRIEQTISLQDNINKRGMQITDMNDRARGKHVFSTKSGLTKKDIEHLDMDNPRQDLVVNGPVNEAHSFVNGTPAQPGLFTELNMDRQRLFAKMGTNATTRGERSGDETAMGRQILRESDFGRIDDMVEETINPAAEKMAMWALQFIRLFYTKEHMVRVLGPDGNTTFMRITNDAVEDGMEIVTQASGVDKLMAKREAYERARMNMTDPLSFFTDVNATDPKGRTEKLMTLQASPELYLQKYIMGNSTTQMAQQLTAASPMAASPMGGAPVAPPAMPVGGTTAQIA
jgi:hypothetical protein